MTRNRNDMIALAAIAVLFLVLCFGGLDMGGQIVVTVLCVGIFAWAKRGLWLLVRANRAYTDKNPAKRPSAIPLYKKAVKAGLGPKHTVTAASILIQEGAVQEGRTALEKMIADPGIKKKSAFEWNQAKVALSMAFYVDKDYERALSLCQEVIDSGHRDKNLYVNMCTYLLALGKVKEFNKLVGEFAKGEATKFTALKDLAITREILRGNWGVAKRELEEFFETRTFAYPDPYVHYAQVKMRCGDADGAVKLLKDALENCVFKCVSVIQPECIKAVIAALEAPEKRDAMMAGADLDPLSLINGEVPALSWEKREIPSDDTPALPEAEEDEVIEEEEESAEKDVPGTEPDSPSTDLNEDDEEWLRRHGG